MLIRQWFASTLFVVGVLCLFLLAVAFKRAYTVTPLDTTDGIPPWTKPAEPRQITGPSLEHVIKATGDSVENALDDQ